METKEKTGPKDKRRNNEKRKEKSRDAARSRRSKETEVFSDLAGALPISPEQVSQLDKASVMRLAIAFLKARNMVSLVPSLATATEQERKNLESFLDDNTFFKFLEGFLLVLSPEGDIVYMSENVSDYLGITQIDLMGQNIYEYSHPCDHDEIKEIISAKTKEDAEAPKSFFIRLKCTLTSKGRSVNLKSATYKVIHFTGHIVENSVQNNKEQKPDNDTTKGSNLSRCLVAVGQPIPHPSNIEAPLPKQTFLTKHSLDMKFTHADDKIMMDVLGYDSNDLVGKSIYDYHHAMDSDSIYAAVKCLFSKGQCETNRYRFLAKTGGYVWVLTQATLIYDNKLMKPQSVVCVNYLISGVENKDEIYSLSQLASVKTETCNHNNNNTVQQQLDNNNEIVNNNNNTTPATILVQETKLEEILNNNPKLISTSPSSPSPILSVPVFPTSKIFAPRTEDMNKGYLTFSEDESGFTMLKDEPDDLTHLAPVAGDVCVPLDDHPFLTDMMLDDFLLRDNFSPLLTDEPTGPFISYRDSYDASPQLLSPNLSKNSECSLPSLNSPSDSLSDEDRMSTFMNLQMEDEPDIVTKAPYIAMNENIDLPLLMSDDLMWSNNEKNKNYPDANSSLAQLLSTTYTKHNLQKETNNYQNSTLEWNNSNKTTKLERSNNKRSNQSTYETNTKRSRNEPKEKMSPELLQQLMANNNNRGRSKGKSNWLLDSGGQKAACISQPSDSVLMNLLDDPMIGTVVRKNSLLAADEKAERIMRQNTIRKNSMTLLEPEATIPSLMDLTQQDYEVNAPVNNLLLQGADLLTALDSTTATAI